VSRRWLLPAAVAMAALLLGAGKASACAVCWGDPESPLVRGAEAAILFMGAVTYLLIGGGVALFVVARRRARRGRAAGEPSWEGGVPGDATPEAR